MNDKKKIIIYSVMAIIVCLLIGIPIGKLLFDVVNNR